MQHKDPRLFDAIESQIDEWTDGTGVPPTVREIARSLGIAPSTVCKYLSAMEDDGRIRFDEHRRPVTRRMQNDREELTRTPLRLSVPLAGSIACGTPDAYEAYTEETFRLPRSLFGDGPLFLLRASGDSMIDAGICDGDLVVVRSQRTAERGQIVVALVDGMNTLKGYFPEPEQRRVRLQPANASMEPMYFRNVEIQGVAVKVIKDLGRM